jgi:hypothetical protein
MSSETGRRPAEREGRDVWAVVQVVGLALLAAGVAVLAWFAVTVGGR